MRIEQRNAQPPDVELAATIAAISENARRQNSMLSNADLAPAERRAARADLQQRQTQLYARRNILRAQVLLLAREVRR